MVGLVERLPALHRQLAARTATGRTAILAQMGEMVSG
jgi:hypothetical protein